jgi:electron-transferring-flavoprotein dehydrogenase
VLEKGSEVGAHILSGAVLDPCGLDALIPDWKEKGAPITAGEATTSSTCWARRADPHPELADAAADEQPRQLHRLDGQCLPLDGRTGRGAGRRDLPRHSCSELVYGENGEVKGVVAGEFGLNPDGTPGPNPTSRGWSCTASTCSCRRGRARSLSKEVIAKFDLDKDMRAAEIRLGMKEIWEIDPEKHREGKVTHTMGWPLGGNAGGGSFIYHLDNNQVYVGFVVHLNYENPLPLSLHGVPALQASPDGRELLKGGKRVAYGARAISEGGWQSMPKLVAPAGAAGLFGGHGQRAAHQGQPQRDAVGQGRGRGRHEAIQAGRAATS